MKKLVSELEGAELDYAVGKALGIDCYIKNDCCKTPTDEILGVCIESEGWSPFRFSPSTSWHIAGAIIEHEGISLRRVHPLWKANKGDMGHDMWGKTPLVAAMRCYVASKFGDEVDV